MHLNPKLAWPKPEGFSIKYERYHYAHQDSEKKSECIRLGLKMGF